MARATPSTSTRPEREPVIGPRAGRRRHALERVQPIHPGGILGPPPRAEVTRVAKSRWSASENVGIEREDDVGAIQAVLRVDVLAERELCAAARVLAAGRIPLMPGGGREACQEVADLRGQCRRAHRLGQDAEAGAGERLLSREHRADRPEKGGPRPDLADVGERLRPIRIVEAEHRGLRERIGCAEATGMERIALDLRGTALVALDEQPGRDAAQRHRGRVEERSAGNELLGLADVRHDLFGRLTGARGHAGQRQGRAHQLQERSTRDRIRDGFDLGGELVVEPLAKGGVAGPLVERAPPGSIRRHRWHVEQLVSF